VLRLAATESLVTTTHYNSSLSGVNCEDGGQLTRRYVLLDSRGTATVRCCISPPNDQCSGWEVAVYASAIRLCDRPRLFDASQADEDPHHNRSANQGLGTARSQVGMRRLRVGDRLCEPLRCVPAHEDLRHG